MRHGQNLHNRALTLPLPKRVVKWLPTLLRETAPIPHGNIFRPGTRVQAKLDEHLPPSCRGCIRQPLNPCKDSGQLLAPLHECVLHKEMEEALKRSEAALKAALEQTKLSLEELSTPVLQVWSNILALPLMGLLDDRRGQQIMEILLQRIVETQSELVILDVTGVPSMDTQVVNYLMKTIRSASMLGAQCVLTGMKPYLAHAVINFGLDLNSLVIRRDMEEGLKWALEQMGYETSDGRASAAKEAVQEQQR